MRRREFLCVVGGVVTAWPHASLAQQQGTRLKRIGVLTHLGEADLEMQSWLAALKGGLVQLGWQEHRNCEVISRFADGRPDYLPALVRELVGMQPDVLVAHAPPATAALKRETSTIPIVFAAVSDPVGQGFVSSLARPGAT
jgi:putative ABC transport system substrate-binding protein